MSDCLFCAIAEGQIPADVVLQTDDVVVFRDVNPQAPSHVLAIPKGHFADVGDLVTRDPELAARVLATAVEAAKELGLDDGYRVVFNTGRDGGQTVPHVHAHVLGGRQMGWPPG